MRLVGLLVAITAASIVSAEAAPDPMKVVDCAAVYSAAGRFVREGARALRQMNKLTRTSIRRLLPRRLTKEASGYRVGAKGRR